VLFCAFLYGVSAVLCKRGLQSNIDIRSLTPARLLVFLLKNRIWILGVCLSFVTNFAIIEIQSFIDISVVYPILNFSYVFVILLGWTYLDEKLSRGQGLGIFTVIMGTVLIIFIEQPITGSGTRFDRLLVFNVVSLLAIVGLAVTAYRQKVNNYEIYYAIATGIAFGNVETYIKANTNIVISEIGEFSIFSVDSLYYFVNSWSFAVLMLFGVIGWLCMQITYSHGNISVSVPVFAVLQSCITISCGYFIFDEYFSLQKVVAITTILSGILMLVLLPPMAEAETNVA
jgi:drug/metabolite transporter (DMT)-like permease